MSDEKKHIGSLFDRIAKQYDRFNHLLSLNIDKRWRRFAVGQLQTKSGNEILALDVAIGTGDMAIELLKQDKVDIVYGIDLSTEMMNIGQQKMNNLGYADKVEFVKGSSLDMPYESDRFDVVSCSYGVRNFEDLDKGLREMYRVLKPNGQLLILEFGYPDNAFVRFFYNLYFTYWMPMLGKLLSKDKSAFTYFNRSVKGFAYGNDFKQHLLDAGFKDIKVNKLSFGISYCYLASK